MKRILLTFLTLLIAFVSYSQSFPTKFMGIPIDGTKSNMINALKAKGFTYNNYNDWLTGQFNGMDVILKITTNKNKVDRILVVNSEPFNEQQIKSQYNALVNQFKKNKKYINPGETDYTIPESENISYEITVNTKRYEASYYQNINFEDPKDVEKYSKYIYSYIDSTKLSQLSQNEQREKIKDISVHFLTQVLPKRLVWFMISETYGKYYINLFYDNEYNRPHGEDL